MRAPRPGVTAMLTLSFAGFAAATVLGIGGVTFTLGRGSLEAAAANEVQTVALEKAAAFEGWVTERHEDVAEMARLPETVSRVADAVAEQRRARQSGSGGDDAGEARAALAAYLPALTGHAFSALFVLDPVDAVVVAATIEDETGKFRESMPYFLRGRLAPTVHGPYYSPQLAGVAMTAAAPVLNAEHQLVGVLAGRLHLDQMADILRQRYGMRQTQEVYAVNSAGQFVTQPRLAPDVAVLNRQERSDTVSRCISGQSGVELADDYRGQPVVVAYRWLAARNLCLLAKFDQAEAFDAAGAFTRAVWITALVILAASVLAAHLVARRLTRPLLRLEAAAQALAAGEETARVRLAGWDEVARLGSAFDAMADALEARTAQRESLLAELESFNYVVSHDLRAPLRSIDGFSQALQEDYAADLEPEALGYLERIRAAAQRMAVLIDDLLSLSRLSRTPLWREPVDITSLAMSVVNDLRRAEPGREVEVAVRPGLRAEADASLVRTVLENLIGNAWKFTGRSTHAEIAVAAEEVGGETRFFVRDNGAGFDMQHADRLFQPFQRLHRQAEFPGTGVGLASVERIVRRHEGHLWAESSPGAGATFWFTLSSASPAVPGVSTPLPASAAPEAAHSVLV